jgi:hypothetical protein
VILPSPRIHLFPFNYPTPIILVLCTFHFSSPCPAALCRGAEQARADPHPFRGAVQSLRPSSRRSDRPPRDQAGRLPDLRWNGRLAAKEPERSVPAAAVSEPTSGGEFTGGAAADRGAVLQGGLAPDDTEVAPAAEEVRGRSLCPSRGVKVSVTIFERSRVSSTGRPLTGRKAEVMEGKPVQFPWLEVACTGSEHDHTAGVNRKRGLAAEDRY